MSDKKWIWAHLLAAFTVTVDDEKRSPVVRQFNFPVLELAIKTFPNPAGGEHETLFRRAKRRVADKALHLNFEQIAAACQPWRDPLGAAGAPANELDGVPVGLLVLVHKTLKTVDDIRAADSNTLEAAWKDLGTLLDSVATWANGPGTWEDAESLVDVSLQASDVHENRIYSWVAMKWNNSEEVGGQASDGMCLLPAWALHSPARPQARLLVPDEIGKLLPDRATAGVWMPDPRTLVALNEPKAIDFTKPASRSVVLELPRLEADELTRAAQLLGSYRLRPGPPDGTWEAQSLWNAALELDPPADEARPDDAKWRQRQAEFNERLKRLIASGAGGFAAADRELLLAAVWARRLRAIASNGLANADGGDVKPIGKVEGLAPAKTSGHAPRADDEAASAHPAPPTLEGEPLMLALYLAVRMGSAASGASARSLNITTGDVGSGVADFWARPQQVYVEVARTIRARFRDESDDSRAAAAKAVEWLRSPRAIGFRPGRSLVGIDVFALTAGATKDKLIAGPKSGEVAELPVVGSNAVELLKSEATIVSLMNALVKVYGDPRPGGLPTFIADLVSAGLKASSGSPVAGTAASDPMAQTEPQIDTAGLRSMLRGFDNSERLICHLANRAKDKKERLTGSRDIVRMGRSRFIDRYKDDDGEFSPAVLSRVYSRAWSKTNARAQFIAATRSSQLPATCKPAKDDASETATEQADGECKAKPAEVQKAGHDGGDFPDLAHLFGLTDVPACSWGDSIHGPAAYLADVLEFLRHRRLISTKSGENEETNALKLLLKRRPDIAEIDLNDKNATVEMPFIDVVNEVLERLVVGKNAFDVDVRLSNWEPRNSTKFPQQAFAALDDALKPWGIQLQEPLLVSAVHDSHSDKDCKHERWMLRDRIGVTLEASRKIIDDDVDPWFVRLKPQTVLSAADLASEPQYVERNAYETLATTPVAGSYALPWSLGETQVREWLDLVGVTPQEVLTKTPLGGATLNTGLNLSHAVARIGMSQSEGAGLVFQPLKKDTLLGVNHPTNLTLSEFLSRSQVSFDDVLALSQTHTIGRAHGFELVPVEGDKCSADSTKINVRWKDEHGASFTGKFLRLRKVLGWTIADLDLALSSPSIGNSKLDEHAAVRIAQFLECRDRLGLRTHDALLVFTRLRTTALDGAAHDEWSSTFLDRRVNGADPFVDLDKKALAVLKTHSRKGNQASTIRSALGESVQMPLEERMQGMLAAVLRVAPTDVDLLVQARLGTGSSWKDLNREGLSQLYGASILQRAAGVDTNALKALVSMVDGNPFKDPGVALEMLDLRKEIEAAGLSPSSLAAILDARSKNPAATEEEELTPSPRLAMNTVLAMHQSLQRLEQKNSRVLLTLSDLTNADGLKEWSEKQLGLVEGKEVSWLDQLSLLTEPVRRLLPRMQVAFAGLRRDEVKAFALGRTCFRATTLLAESLEQIESELDKLPHEGKTGDAGLLRRDVASWIVNLFAPILQWIGLSEENIESRLRPWLEAEAAQHARQSQPSSAGAENPPKINVPLASFLLCQPLDRFTFMQDRRAALSTALSQALSTEEHTAWALLNATPAGPKDKNAADWWLELDLTVLEKAWLGPAKLSLEALSSDAPLKNAFALINAIHGFSHITEAFAIDASTLRWLYEKQNAIGSAPPSDQLGIMAPSDLLANAENKSAAVPSRPQLVSKWRLLCAWSKAFKGTPDVTHPAAAGGLVSLRRNVLEPLLVGFDPATDDGKKKWANLCVALDRLLGRDAGTTEVLLVAAGNRNLILKPATLSWLSVVSEFLTRSGLPIDELREVADSLRQREENGLLAASGKLRSSLRKRFSDDAWSINVRKGQNKLREQKRDALVALLLSQTGQSWSANPNQPSADSLYEYLLLDTQMSACMTTSRIVQAHAVVQQFAQRCTMGLEAGWRIPANELVDWKQWKWMQSYRVWEACRKIFLYPENWMEPEVRDDKSRFFEELESDLNQGELTNENAELAFARYLHKLHDVARLDVVATYYEFDANEPVMHILARTPSEPYRYYYRQWVDERHWTPWDLVDLEIDSQHILLFKRGGRLCLGWMTAKHEQDRPKVPSTFTTVKREDAVKQEDTYTVSGIEEPSVCWKLQLTTSQKANEGWQPKRTSPRQLEWPPKSVAMSKLAADFVIDRLQLTFQDYGLPEILVTAFEPQLEENTAKRHVIGSFSLQSCLGVAQAERVSSSDFFAYPVVDKASSEGARQIELKGSTNQQLILVEGAANAIASAHPSILKELATAPGVDPTPGRFAVTPATQVSLLDAAIAAARAALVPPSADGIFTMGLGLPFFYADDAVDIVVRPNFSSKDTAGSTRVNARHISRSMAALRDALLTEEVQEKVWRPNANKAAWAKEVLAALSKAAPLTSVGALADLLAAVSSYSPNDGSSLPPFEMAARTHHPMACELVNRVEARGVATVFNGKLQQTKRETVYRGRTSTRLSTSAIERFGCYALAYDDTYDAYASYNWEVFYHAPLMIALKFASEAKFEDSMRWFHYIFDPIGVDEGTSTDADGVRRQFWKMRPFRTGMEESYKGHLVEVLLDPKKWGKQVQTSALQDLVDSIMAWRRKPNLPFQVARGRWTAFQKAVVYRYIDVLIAWGDARFRSDTREDITAASQLYVLAARLLGRRPRNDITMCDRGSAAASGAQNYLQLQQLIDQRDDELSAYLDQLLGEVSDISECEENEEPDSPHLNFYNEYFCIPPNEKLFDLWDRVADRLYKVRNCLNIDGVFRIPSLFAPPIDPALLARAGAAGLSFDQIMAGLNQPRSHYRFSVMLQKANEVAVELRTLGSELLQALEKRDAEELSLLRSRLDLQATRLNMDIRDEQIKEATTQLEAITVQIANIQTRQSWYLERIAKGTSPKELESIEGIRSGLMVRTRVAAMKSAAAIASTLPRFTLGVNGAFGSPHNAFTISGELFANSQNFFADKLAVEGDKDQTAAGITATLASYERRLEDWQLQRDTASGELLSLDKQRIAAEIRLTIALTEKRNLERSIESAEATDTFLTSKFTSSGLYDWMVRQVSAVYYKTYQLASDYARSAEDCLNRELPVSQSGVKVVRSDHWNGLRKGLLAATGLIHDLKRLEAEHIKRNQRIPELTKHVSLAVLHPARLIELRATGKCRFKIPEVLFELDHPGHVGRRIKSVALSLPCVTSPYAGVSCKLSLLSSSIKKRGAKEPEKVHGPAEAIFTSSGSNDTGLWELNLRDERYLPFEGSGAVDSEWELRLPAKVRQFDYATISDVILHIRYISEPGDNVEAAEDELGTRLRDASAATGPLWAYTSLRNDLSEQFTLLARKKPTRRIDLTLPSELARWMGQPVVPTGKFTVAVIGSSNGTVVVRLGGIEARCMPYDDNPIPTSWSADIDLKPQGKPPFPFDGSTLALEVDGVDELRDIVICFVATLAT